MPVIRLFLFLFAILAGPVVALTLGAGTPPAANPIAECTGCHREIYENYQKTPMAQASGTARDGLLPGEFTHAASGVHYRLFLRDDRVWLNYDRPNAPPEHSLRGEQ